MSRENVVEAFILKKQDYAETDQIITIFSKEQGKLRCLVKAAKSPTSKLQPALQPKVIRTQTVQTYSGVYGDPVKIQSWFVVAEFLIKSLGDGAPNEQLYGVIADYLAFLNSQELSADELDMALVQFQIKALGAIGLGVQLRTVAPQSSVWFSQYQGGFVSGNTTGDAAQVTVEQYVVFSRMVIEPFQVLSVASADKQRITQLVQAFVTYQLERELKSHRFLSARS